MKKILVVFGTRPEAIKMCPVVKSLKKNNEMETIVCVTGQHKEMLQSVLDVFAVKPNYNLSIMKKGQTLFDITQLILEKMQAVLQQETPDMVLVHGDTTTAFATALAAFYLNIPVGHVEAGLRTYNPHAPYPEEFNRQAIGSMADLHFATTQQAAQRLLAEGKKENSIFVTGNTVIDALRTTVQQSYTHPVLEWLGDSRLLLMTAHRRENIGAPMQAIFKAVKQLVKQHPDIKVLYPVHPNPAVGEVARDMLGNEEHIKLVEPLDVLDFHNLMARSHLILTDSGGVQEEAPSLGKPVLVLRDVTERPEGVEAGALKLVGTNQKAIVTECSNLLQNPAQYQKMSKANNPYGDGHAAEKITDILQERIAV
ncbi:UDP-N-acetylglucosamine 2-epimerase (non-hydrolyzing) [Ruminococcaceae bacterium OttesenSCG-928-A16]|nr:UDP-N-acetylglucosamine 2-epimerase (non-hydrolyzing) [Ruminococcaceae bacterium OttesenSCG-928-A16]